MFEFIDENAYYIVCFLAGYYWYPMWGICKLIYSNAKKADLGDNFKQEDEK